MKDQIRKCDQYSNHGDVEAIFDKFTFHDSMFDFLEFNKASILFLSFILDSLDIADTTVQSGMHRNTKFTGRLIAGVHDDWGKNIVCLIKMN